MFWSSGGLELGCFRVGVYRLRLWRIRVSPLTSSNRHPTKLELDGPRKAVKFLHVEGL